RPPRASRCRCSRPGRRRTGRERRPAAAGTRPRRRRFAPFRSCAGALYRAGEGAPGLDSQGAGVLLPAAAPRAQTETIMKKALLLALACVMSSAAFADDSQTTVFDGARIIDGTGKPA